MASNTKTVADFQRITGLKEKHATACFNAFGGYAPALASFAQSFAALPKDCFDNYTAAVLNAEKINEELRGIYKKARELKAKSGKKDAEVWQEYNKIAPQPSANAAPSQPVFSSPFASAGAAASGAASAPATVSPFSKGPGAAFVFSAEVGKGTTAPPPASTTSLFAFGTGTTTTTPFVAAPVSSSPFAKGPATVSFGFGAPSGNSTTAPAVPPSFGFAGGAIAVDAAASTEAAPAESEPAKEKAPVRYCEPKHFTGPYFEMPNFWQEEVIGRAPLLNLNNGFLEAHKSDLHSRMEVWARKAAFHRKPVQYVEIDDEDEEVIRVIIKDADRTFFHPDHRAKLVAFLNAMYHEFNAYGQAMSYLAGLCMLVLTEEDTAAIIRFVSTEYIKGHWAAEAVGFATSAWVVEYFMKKTFPDVAKHLDELKFWPDTYLQKILTGLCIHVLQFNELFDFLDAFMMGGLKYLIRFCLAIVEHFRADILAIKSTTEANELYEIMRLDSRVADVHDVRAILKRAPAIDLGEEGDSLDLIRSKVFEEKVEPRLKRAPKTEVFEPCAVCEKNRPKWWSEELGLVCDSCKEAHPSADYEKY